jgi:hypothetical protein
LEGGSGGGREGECPVHLFTASLFRSSLFSKRFHPSEALLDLSSDGLADFAATMSGGTPVDGRPPARLLAMCGVTLISRSSMTKSALS